MVVTIFRNRVCPEHGEQYAAWAKSLVGDIHPEKKEGELYV